MRYRDDYRSCLLYRDFLHTYHHILVKGVQRSHVVKEGVRLETKMTKITDMNERKKQGGGGGSTHQKTERLISLVDYALATLPKMIRSITPCV